MSDRKEKIRKLKKLFEHSDSAKNLGSEAEAQAFAEMAQKLLVEYKIDTSELSEEEEEQELRKICRVRPRYSYGKKDPGIRFRSRRIEWLVHLAIMVADAHFCRVVVIKGTSTVDMAGRRHDAETAAEVYEQLVEAAERIADKEYARYFYKMRDEGLERKARGYRGSFLLGFCSRIGQKYREHMAALKEYYAHDQKALEILKGYGKDIEEFFDQDPTIGMKDEDRRSLKVANLAGWSHGRDQADRMELSKSRRIR